jgi:hypothetical protein
MVIGKLPVVAVVVVATEKVDVVVVGFGAKDPVAPAARPLELNVTEPVNPPDGVTVTVYEVEAPRTTVCEEGVAERAKSGPGGGGGAAPTAFAALSRPPVTVRPLSEGMGSTLLSSADLTPAVANVG